MKKIRIISLALAIGLISVMLASCTKTPSDTSRFKSIASEKGYMIQDVLSQFSDTPQIREATVTAPEGFAFQIEFYVVDSSDFAKTFFTNLSAVIEGQKGSVYSGGSLNGKNYAKRTMTSGGQYTMVEYIENTLVYVPLTDADNKSAVEAFLKEMGY